MELHAEGVGVLPLDAELNRLGATHHSKHEGRGIGRPPPVDHIADRDSVHGTDDVPRT